jgi:hypothetical protein
MNRALVFGFAIAIITGEIQAQDNAMNGSKRMLRFHSFNIVQVLRGSTTTSYAFNTVNGVQSGKFFGGIGAGLDYYYHKSVPLFLEARFDLLKRKSKLQVFGDGGLNFPFSSQNLKFEFNTGKYKTGGLYGGGIDYLIPVKKAAIIVGAAFSNKQIIHMVDNNTWNPFLNRMDNIPRKDKYSLNRVAIRVGWMF